MTQQVMFKSIDVWKRLDNGGLARYRCFELVPGNRYCVQSVDFYNDPFDVKRMQELDQQFIELLSEASPDLTNETYETLAEAIANHDLDFRQFEDDINARRG